MEILLNFVERKEIETMKNWIKAGIFTPQDPREWVRKKTTREILEREKELIKRLSKKGVEVIKGGEKLPEEDQVAWNTKLVFRHIDYLVKNKIDVLIVNEAAWTFPYDTIDAIKYYGERIGKPPKVLMFSHMERSVPGLVAGMAIEGGLKRIGYSCYMVYGLPEESGVIDEIVGVLRFLKGRIEAEKKVMEVLKKLPKQKYIAFGGMSLKMPTTTADVDQWQKIFKVSYDALDQSVILERAWKLVEWKGKPGESEYRIIDQRVKNAKKYILEEGHGKVDFSRPKLRGPEKLVYQLSLFYAVYDICKERNCTFAGIKCQDELSARECTACIPTAFLNNDVGPDGKRKKIIPTACENDMDSALTQLLLHLLSGRPAGFGDFRDIRDGILYIINCGQHPPYFFGKPDEEPEKKLDRVEYLGQEIYYLAGGSAVRGRTPAGQIMTVARLGRDNLRYKMVALPIETIEVKKDEHEMYDYSWPIIKGRIPISEKELVEMWPCNHLAFTYGDYTPHLVELCEHLNIGYTIYDREGRKYYRPP